MEGAKRTNRGFVAQDRTGGAICRVQGEGEMSKSSQDRGRCFALP